jgi:hypothetical protein
LPGVVRIRSSNVRSLRACWRLVTVLAIMKRSLVGEAVEWLPRSMQEKSSAVVACRAHVGGGRRIWPCRGVPSMDETKQDVVPTICTIHGAKANVCRSRNVRIVSGWAANLRRACEEGWRRESV